MHFFRLLDELFPELGMRHRNNGLGLFPGGKALQVHHAVLCHQVMDVGPGVGDDGAVGQGGQNAGLQVALFVLEGGGAADEALAALGKVSAQHKVQLAACAADLLRACRLGIHLAEQVQVYRVVDGNKVVNGGDGAHVVGVVHRNAHQLRVVVHVVVHLLGARAEGVHLAEAVNALPGAGDFPRPGNVHKGVHVHFCVYAQILQIRLGNEGAYRVGHAANAKLQAGPVGDLLHNQLCHGLVHRGGRRAAHFGNGRVFALHNHVHLGNVDPVFRAAQAAGHVLVDLHNDGLGPVAHRPHVGSAGAEIEVAVLVHRRNLEHGHVDTAVVAYPVRWRRCSPGNSGAARNSGSGSNTPGRCSPSSAQCRTCARNSM